MKPEEINKLRAELASPDIISFDRSFELVRLCSKLIQTEETRFLGREIVIRALDALEKIDKKTHDMWYDLVESCGLYPYLVDKFNDTGAGLLRFEFHKSKYLEKTYLHEEQMMLSIELDSSKSIIISAPTSFGKSLLIEELVVGKKYKNIVIIQPSLALLDETRKKFKKYQSYYNIIVSTSQEPTSGPNLFLLTAERLVEYTKLPKIDFFVIDEFYKLNPNEDDARASILNYAFYTLLKMTKNFYLLGPNISSIPKGFEEKYGAKFIESRFTTVAVDIQKFENLKDEERESKLFELLSKLTEPTLIYCSNPDKANALLMKFNSYCIENNLVPKNKPELEHLDILEWLEKNIHPQWKLREALTNSMAVHHGSLPRHIGSTIIDYFNKNKIQYLFCTSTLIEGVNTSAKNVVLFDKTKGTKGIDYFDFMNIVGRSGRMTKHFIGKVYQFHPEPSFEKMNVDIPFYTQDRATDDLLAQLDPSDVKDKNSDRYKKLMELLPEHRELIKRNKGISIEEQIAAIKLLESDVPSYHEQLCWSGRPTWDQLKFLINFCWNAFPKQVQAKHRVRTANQLAFYTNLYINSETLAQFIMKLINSDRNKANPDIQYNISLALSILRNWFDYTLPKLIKTVSELQKFVFENKGLKPGNYDHLASLVENNLLPNNLAILLEYDVPPTAIYKLREHLKGKTVTELKSEIISLDLKKLGLIDYEINKLKSI